MVGALCILAIFLADLIKPPSIVPSDSGGVVVSMKGGERRWAAHWTMEPIERDRKKAIRFTERGQGHVSPYSGEVRWMLEAVWSAENGLRPVSTEKTVTSVNGARVAIERKHFDLAKNVVRFERQFSDGRSEEKSLSIPPDTLAVEGIAGILRFLPFDQVSFPAHLLSNEPRLYSVTFETRGKERVRTPAGDFNAYKVEMVPHLGGLLNVFRSFAPKAFFWFTVEEPHFWVRYQGIENGPGTPEIVMELDRTVQ